MGYLFFCPPCVSFGFQFELNRGLSAANIEGQSDVHDMEFRDNSRAKLSDRSKTSVTAKMARPLKESLEETRRIRAEQDAAYEAAIKIDREKARRRQLQEDQARKELQRKQTIKQQKKDFLARLKPEPEASTEGVFSVTAVLPSGKRITRRFVPTEQLLTLFYFIFCDEDSPDEFDVVTAYPKRILPCRPKEVQIKTPWPPGEGPDDSNGMNDTLGLDVGLTFDDFGITVNHVVFVINI